MNNIKNIKELLNDMNGGCSSISWITEDEKHLWGRNFDFNRMAQGTKITYIPKGKVYYGCGTSLENNVDEEIKTESIYATVGTVALQTPFVVTYILTHCSSVEEVVDVMINKVTVVSTPMFGNTPTIHWSFTDRTGENIIIECDKNGMHINRNTMGVMTNSPDYNWHRLNLSNYFNIRNLDYDYLDINGVKGKNEEQGVINTIHLFNNVAFSLGFIEVSETGDISEYDSDVVPYDYTVYTAVMCSESLKYYWVTHENQRVQCVDINDLLSNDDFVQFEMDKVPDIKYLTK